MSCKLRDEARQYFKDKGLSYERIGETEIYQLSTMLKLELARYLIEGGEHALQMDMRVSKMRAKDLKVSKKGLEHARIQIDGSYFERREGITFATSGFIGLGCEFSDVNIMPIITAFLKWCDMMVKGSDGE